MCIIGGLCGPEPWRQEISAYPILLISSSRLWIVGLINVSVASRPETVLFQVVDLVKVHESVIIR